MDDIHASVRRFFQLWQEQCVMLAREPEVIAALFQSFNMMQDTGKKSGGENAGQHPSGATPDVSGNGDDAGDQLLARLAACEERIATLERQLAERSGTARRNVKEPAA